jgi:hypothetical protein
MLDSVLREEGRGDVAWHAAYLRERLAERQAEGYKTWDDRMAELDRARQAPRPDAGGAE